MLRATRVEARESAGGGADDVVVLDWDRRHRRRLAMTSRGGTGFLLDLAAATALRTGDVLVLEDGRRVRVEAEAEPVADIAAADAAALVRIAWHLGNRHLPTQMLGDRLRIRRDHVIEEMVRGLGGHVELVTAPFDPEGGAYGHGRAHGHDHAHRHHHAHDRANGEDGRPRAAGAGDVAP